MEHIFREPPQRPYTYNFTYIKPGANSTDLFETIKNLLFMGLKTRCNKNSVAEVTEEDIKIIAEYMMSIGIKMHYQIFTPDELDYCKRSLLADLETVKKLSIDVTLNWRTQKIKAVTLKLHNPSALQHVNVIFQRHNVANMFLNLYKPQSLSDHGIIVNTFRDNKPIIVVIYFDYGRRLTGRCSK